MKKILISVIIVVVFMLVVYMVVSKGERKEVGNNLPGNDVINNNLNINETRPSVLGSVWKWQGIIMSDDTTIVPASPDVFTLTFTQEGQVSGTTDCNSFSGTYIMGEDGLVTWGAFASTQMFCENSQEAVFLEKITNADRVFFDEAGNLILLLKLDSGAVIFKK